jgi:iron complex outermembrane receptor protein
MRKELKFFRAGLLSTAASGAVLIAAPAFAQDAEEPTDEVVVTGIRKSIGDSIAVKRDNTSIVEAVSAEDIGKLPDFSIAESLSRLPGLAAQRVNGRARSISLRGLGPDFTNTLLNGRQQVTTNDNRSAEFDAYPGELIGQALVYKTPEAGLVGQGIAGVIDLRTLRPLDFGEQRINLTARGIVNEVGSLNAGTPSMGYDVSATFIDQFADDTIGVAIGYARINQPNQVERFNAWGYGSPAEALGNSVIGGMKPFVQSTELSRDGVFATLQWEPSDRFSTTLDGYYTRFNELRTLRGIEFPLGFACCAPGTTFFGPLTLTNVQASNGFVTSGTFNNVKGVIRNDAEERDADLYAFGWNAKYQANDRLSFDVDASYSFVDRLDGILETYSGTGSGVGVGATDNLSFVTGPTGTTFTSNTLDYSNYAAIGITSPLGWGGDRFNESGVQVAQGGQVGFYNRPSIEEDLYQLRASANYEFGDGGFFSGVRVGVDYTDREKSKAANEFFIDLAGFQTFVPIPTDLRLDPTELGYLGLGGMVSYDPFALIQNPIIIQTRNFNADVLTKSWTVEEKILTGFAVFDIDGMIGALPVRGNIGVQVVQTDQSSTGARAAGSAPNVSVQQVSDGVKYTKLYPSANLSFEITDDQIIRLGAARVAMRPRMDQLSISQQVNYTIAFTGGINSNGNPADDTANVAAGQTYYGASGGNPFLKPWIVDQFDVAYEHYFADDAYFSVSAYYKLFENYIFSGGGYVADFTGFPTNSGDPVPDTRLGIVRVPVNQSGGYVRGVEVATSIPFGVLSPALEGFGFIGSVAFNGSKIEPIPGVVIPVPGFSKRTASMTLYYERDGFRARVSDRYRARFLGEVPGFGNAADFVLVEPEHVLDAQIGYDFDKGALAGFGVVAEVQNITDEPFVTLQGLSDLAIRDYQSFGRTYRFGISYRF